MAIGISVLQFICVYYLIAILDNFNNNLEYKLRLEEMDRRNELNRLVRKAVNLCDSSHDSEYSQESVRKALLDAMRDLGHTRDLTFGNDQNTLLS